jgi:hypothetical protein
MMSLYWGQPLQLCAVPHYDVPLLTNSLVFVSQCSNQWLTLVSAFTPLSPLSVAVSVSSAVFVDVVPLAFCTVFLFVLGELSTMKTWGREGVAPCIPNFDSTWKCVIAFTSQLIELLTSQGKSHLYLCNRKLAGPQSLWAEGHSLPLLRIRHWLSGCQALSLVTVVTV